MQILFQNLQVFRRDKLTGISTTLIDKPWFSPVTRNGAYLIRPACPVDGCVFCYKLAGPLIRSSAGFALGESG